MIRRIRRRLGLRWLLRQLGLRRPPRLSAQQIAVMANYRSEQTRSLIPDMVRVRDLYSGDLVIPLPTDEP